MKLELTADERACLISALDTLRVALSPISRGSPTHKLAGELMDRLAKLEPEPVLGEPPAAPAGQETFLIQRRRDAFANYEAYVIAANAEEAQQKAMNGDIVGKWIKGDVDTFDAYADDVLTADGGDTIIEGALG